MGHEEPKRAPRGLQEGAEEGSKRDLGTNLAQRALRKPPGTLPDPSGERFRDQFGPKSGPQEAKIVENNLFFKWGGARLLTKKGMQGPV